MEKKMKQVIYDFIKNQSQLLFFVVDVNGQILEASNYAESITGSDLNQKKFQDLVVDFTGSFDLNDRILRGPEDHLLNIKMASGLPQSYYFHFAPIDSRILVFGRSDTEELASMKKEMLSLNQELNNMTRSLHKKNIQLQRLNTEKNQFLGMAAHDLRKPIGLILNYSEFLTEELSDFLNSEQKGFLNTITASSELMKKLVDDFLDVSAIEAGMFDLYLKPADISNILENSLILNRIQAEKKKIELHLRVGKSIPPVVIDPSKIGQAITNLISNAIDHSEPNTKITISLFYDSGAIVFSVQDTGAGISQEKMKRLFMPFDKTGATKTSGEKSTGLGLVIAHKIIEAHHGKLQIESSPEKGTFASFTIPLKEI